MVGRVSRSPHSGWLQPSKIRRAKNSIERCLKSPPADASMAMRTNLSPIIIIALTPFLGALDCTTEGNNHNLQLIFGDCGAQVGIDCTFDHPIALHGTVIVQISRLDNTPIDDVDINTTNTVAVNKMTRSDGHTVFKLVGASTGNVTLTVHPHDGTPDDTVDVTVLSPNNLRFKTIEPEMATVTLPMGTMNTEKWDIPSAGFVRFHLLPFFGDQQLMGQLQYHRDDGAILPGEITTLASTDGELAAHLTQGLYHVQYHLDDPAAITFMATITVH